MSTSAAYGRAGTKAAALRQAVYGRLLAHEQSGELPTSNRFVLYELRQHAPDVLHGHKSRRRGRSEDQNLSDASKWLRDEGIVPWSWIVDETRELTSWAYASTVIEYAIERVRAGARLDVWDGAPPPLLLCESRTFGGVMKRTIAPEYLCPVAATNGQCGGFLHTNIAPVLTGDGEGRPVLYIGDFDRRGEMIETNTRRVLEEVCGPLDWRRVALTAEQVTAYNLPVVQKHDRVLGGSFDAVEVEALGQGTVTALIRDALDALLPEPLDRVQVRGRKEKQRVLEALEALR